MELQHLSLLRYRLMTTYSHFGMDGYEVLRMNEGARAHIIVINTNTITQLKREPLECCVSGDMIDQAISKRAHLYDALDLFDSPRAPSLLVSLHATEPAVRAMTSDLDTPDPSAPHRSSITDP